ncbi:homeobox-leucine zipper protein HAT22-like [Mercurialis annua]|uniref:homeobox-leucine zipper protein HAT22-like n=1 Tax=Mercurialis annua TaxID=3986 RepID=UPI00215F0B5C|nr:homeobox-leucine zipper protein HAT22-like [Mercurialis annua]
MGFGISDQVICNTGLGLGLICPENQEMCYHDHHHHQEKKTKICLKDDHDHTFPCLTLGLQPAVTIVETDLQPRVSSPSAVSNSFSHSSMKKEIESVGGGGGGGNGGGAAEEEEKERVSSRGSDEDEDGSPRKKLRLTKQQSAILEDNFKEHSTLNPKQKQELADHLNLRPRQVEVWFQNRRARTKLKQTEVDCEVLKKYCETLTEENRRLQKELQDLKTLKLQAAPLFMQLPAATLAMCPSCERIAGNGAGDGSSSTSTITVGAGPKPHLYSLFTHHPSAAC